MPDRPTAPRRWLDHLVAAFVTFHLAVVVVHLVPSPPRVDDKVLAHPDVREELDRVTGLLARWSGREGEGPAIEDELVAWVRWYDRRTDRIRRKTGRYLRPIGSTQSWNMFGGNPGRFPRVLHVAVLPEGEAEPVLVADHGWDGTPIVHRHRKISRNLAVRGFPGQRDAYAAWHARQWNQAHPDRPASEVQMWFEETRIPRPAKLLAGVRSEPRIRLKTVWEAP